MPALRFNSSYRSVVEITRLVGLYIPYEDNELTTRRIIYVFYNIVVGVFLIWKTFCSTLGVMYNNFEDAVMAEWCFLLQSTALLLMLFYFCRRERVGELVQDLDRMCLRITGSGFGKEEYFRSLFREDSRRMSLLHKAFCTSTVLCPFLYVASAVAAVHFTGTEKSVLPVPIYCGFEVAYPPFYELFAFFQFLGNATPALQKLGNEFLLFGIMKVQASYFKYLNETMKSIQIDIKTKPRNSVRRDIIEWIKIHQEAIRCTRDFQDLVSPIVVLYYLIMISLTASGLFYQLNAESVSVIQFSTLGIYMAISTLQFYLLCYMADEVSHQAEEIAVSAYFFPWYKLERGNATLIQMAINMGNQPLRMAAYKAPSFSVSKEAFLSYMVNVVSAYMAFSKIMDIE